MLVNHLLTGIILQVMLVVSRIRELPHQQKTCSSGLAATVICPEMAESFLQRSPWIKHFTTYYQLTTNAYMIHVWYTCLHLLHLPSNQLNISVPWILSEWQGTWFLGFLHGPAIVGPTRPPRPHVRRRHTILPYFNVRLLWEWYECFRVAFGKFGGRWTFSRFPEYEKHIKLRCAASGRIRKDTCSWLNMLLGGGFYINIFNFIPNPGGDDPIWLYNIFQLGWWTTTHQVDMFFFSLPFFSRQGCLLDKDPVSIWTVRWRFGRQKGGFLKVGMSIDGSRVAGHFESHGF